MINISYEPCEKETHITTDEESRTWNIYTLQTRIVTKLKKLGIEPYKTSPDGEFWFKDIPFNQVSFRGKSTRIMSDEQKKAASERLSKAREAKK